jgi:hypothetical protein
MFPAKGLRNEIVTNELGAKRTRARVTIYKATGQPIRKSTADLRAHRFTSVI